MAIIGNEGGGGLPSDWPQFVTWYQGYYGRMPSYGDQKAMETYKFWHSMNVIPNEQGETVNPPTQPGVAPAPPTPPAATTPEAAAPTTTTPATDMLGMLPEGYQIYIPGLLIVGPDGKFYDWNTWEFQSQLVSIPDDQARTIISNWQGGKAGELPFAGVPTKEKDASGQEWWVYRDTEGNIVKVDMVTDATKDMTEYEKSQYDLAREQFEWNKQQAEAERVRAEQAKFTSPRDWIQRWGMQNPGTLPNAMPWMGEFTGLQPHQQIAPTAPKLGSGQSLSRLSPSELEGMYGYVDWAAGRGSPYASGEDWMYRSQQLLPTNAPKRTTSWNPNVRV